MTPLPAFLAEPALLAVMDAVPAARLVGGCVRDAVAGRDVADIDLATPDAPEVVVELLRRAGLKSAPTGLKHGTVTAISDHRGFEITTLRRDVVADGRHATVAWTSDWAVDAARRDFTINAMSMARDGAIFDYVGGLDDLRAGRVRFVGDAAARIAEDYLRILRYFRFQARYGLQEPDLETETALSGGVPGMARLSQERVWSELKRILVVPDPMAAFQLMARLGVLAAVLPEGRDLAALSRLVAAGAPADPLLRLAALAPGQAAALAARLRLSVAECHRLTALNGPAPDPELDGAALRRAVASTEQAVLIGRSWLADGPAGAAVRARIEAIGPLSFPLAGRDAVALGVPPGPAVGGLIRAVRAWWMEGGCVAGGPACRAELRRLIGQAGPD